MYRHKNTGTGSLQIVKCGYLVLLLLIGTSVIFILYINNPKRNYSYKQFTTFGQNEQLVKIAPSFSITDMSKQNHSSPKNPISVHIEKHIDILNLDDLFITVKTTKNFHATRLNIVIKTWFTKAAKQTYIFTDYDDAVYQKLTNGHIINTHCNSHHTRRDLSCKMGAEYNAFLDTNKKWWCHFDDDNYVNVNRLLLILRKYDWEKDVYLGKPSIAKPLHSRFKGELVQFWFATGGAGLCISRSLAEKMSPWSRYQKFTETSNDLLLPDDCTLGFIITNRLSVNLTYSSFFHSHLEPLNHVKQGTLSQQVSLSYNTGLRDFNVIILDPIIAAFNATQDPTRLFSVHCFLYPDTEYCHN